MSWLLDTNVISELRKPRADANVTAWVAARDAEDLFVSVITLHEIEVGILLKERSDARQGAMLRAWFTDAVLPAFASGRTLQVDLPVARLAAALTVPDRRPASDLWIAATAIVHQMPIVTRNVNDFANVPGLSVVNPWEGTTPS